MAQLGRSQRTRKIWRFIVIIVCVLAPSMVHALLPRLKGTRTASWRTPAPSARPGRKCAFQTTQYQFWVEAKPFFFCPVGTGKNTTYWCWDGKRTYRSAGAPPSFFFDRALPSPCSATLVFRNEVIYSGLFYPYRNHPNGGLWGKTRIHLSFVLRGIDLGKQYDLSNFMHYDGTYYGAKDLGVHTSESDEPALSFEEGPDEGGLQGLPPDGVFVRSPDGRVYRMAGGSPVYLSNCAGQGYFPGCSSIQPVSQEDVSLWLQLQPVPSPGTLVRRPDGAVFRMECGKGLYVSNCAQVGGCAGLVDLDATAVNQLAASAGCDDGNPCTTDRCDNLTDCRREFAFACLAPILSLLDDDRSCGNGTVGPGEHCDDGNVIAGDGCSATCAVEACFACLASGCSPINTCANGDGCCPNGCYGQDNDCATPIAGTTLQIRDDQDATKRQITFVARDALIDATAVNPVADGAALQIFSPMFTPLGADGACMSLANSYDNWRATGTGATVSYKYRDRLYVNGPCRRAGLKRGVLSVMCRARSQPIDYALDESAQGRIAVNFISGAHTFCAEFGGTISIDSGTDPPISGGRGAFVAADAPAPATCASPPRACR